MRRSFTLVLTLALALSLAACSSGGASPTPGATVAPTPGVTAAPPAGGEAVTIIDFDFQPADLTIKVGTKVTWTNTGSAPHTVKWGDGTPQSARLLSGGAPYERTFDAAGIFTYVCGIHGSMKATVTVTE